MADTETWRRRVASWRASGQTAAEYSARHGAAVATLLAPSHEPPSRSSVLPAATGEEVGGGDVAERAVEADVVVVLDEAGDELAGLVEGRRPPRRIPSLLMVLWERSSWPFDCG